MGVSSLPDKDAFSILDFQLSTLKFQISLSIVNYFGLLLRSFPVATPFLPRSYLVPTPNLFQTFRLVVPLLSACYFLAIGLFLRTLPQCYHDVSTYSNCQLEFSTFNSQLSTKKLSTVNWPLSIIKSLIYAHSSFKLVGICATYRNLLVRAEHLQFVAARPSSRN